MKGGGVSSGASWDEWVDGLHGALTRARRLVSASRKLDIESGHELMRSFHLLKGFAQALGLHDLQAVAHDLESGMSRMLKTASGGPAELKPFREGIRKLDAALARLDDPALRELASRESGRLSEPKPLAVFLERMAETARCLAVEMRQEVEVSIACAQRIELAPSWRDALGAALLHAIRNSLDHGGRRGSVLRIRLSARKAGERVVIECSDSGVGIDPEQVRAAARLRHARFDAEMGGLSDQAVLRLLFHPGFSLSRGVSRLSGRGYGLDIVREAVEARLHGSVRLESTPGQGTRLTFNLPVC